MKRQPKFLVIITIILLLVSIPACSESTPQADETRTSPTATDSEVTVAPTAMPQPTDAPSLTLAQSILTNYKQLGPYNVAQRSTALHIDDTNPQRWYLGTDGGGLWISNDAGATWEKMDKSNSLGSKIIDIEQDRDNPDNIYYLSVGPEFSNEGIYHSTDGGNTFQQLIGAGNIIRSFDGNDLEIINSKIFVQSKIGIYTVAPDGKSAEVLFSLEQDSNNEYLFRMEVLKEDANTEHVVFTTDSKVYRGGDAPGSFSVVLENSEANGCDIGYSRNHPNVIYALFAIENKVRELYRSDDYGAAGSWQLVHDVEGQSMFATQGDIFWGYEEFNGIWVDADNPDILIITSTDMYLSEDSGKNWHFIRSSTEDISFGDMWPNSFQRNPVNNKLIVGHDHGLFEAVERDLFDFADQEYSDAIEEGRFINKAQGVAAFTGYVGSYFGTGDEFVVGGQDRGSWAIYEDGSELFVGGGDVHNLLASETRIHSFNKHGSVLLENYDYEGNRLTWVDFSDELDTYDTKGQSDIGKQSEIFYVNDYPNSKNQHIVFKSTDLGNTLLPIYTSNTRITSLVANPVSGHVYIFEGQEIKRIEFGSNVVTELMTSSVLLDEIRLLETDENIIYGWNSDDVYRFDIAEQTQTQITGSRDFNPHYESVTNRSFYAVSSNILFLGTSHGLLFSEDGGANWKKDNIIPTVIISDIDFRRSDSRLFLFTYGMSTLVATVNK